MNGTIKQNLDAFSQAMADCKAALKEKGLSLSKNPRLTDLPNLINAIGSGSTPSLSSVSARDLETNLGLISPTLEKIKTALTNKGVSVGGGLKIKDLAGKIRSVVTQKIYFIFFNRSGQSIGTLNISGPSGSGYSANLNTAVKHYTGAPDTSIIPTADYNKLKSTYNVTDSYLFEFPQFGSYSYTVNNSSGSGTGSIPVTKDDYVWVGIAMGGLVYSSLKTMWD